MIHHHSLLLQRMKNYINKGIPTCLSNFSLVSFSENVIVFIRVATVKLYFQRSNKMISLTSGEMNDNCSIKSIFSSNSSYRNKPCVFTKPRKYVEKVGNPRTATGMDGTFPPTLIQNLKPVEISKNHFNII